MIKLFKIQAVITQAFKIQKEVLQTLCLTSVVVALGACGFLPAKNFPLSSVTSEAHTVVAQQQWQLHYNKEQYSLQVIVERTPTHWQWIMLNNLGQRLATATVTGATINIAQQQSHPANPLIRELLEAVQFSYWPIEDLQNMDNLNWTFQEGVGHRDIYFSGILRATVNYQLKNQGNSSGMPEDNYKNKWRGGLTYDNKKSDFHLVIESQLLH